MDSKLIVIAIGGNSLIEDSKHVTVSAQYEAASKTAYHIARLITSGRLHPPEGGVCAQDPARRPA